MLAYANTRNKLNTELQLFYFAIRQIMANNNYPLQKLRFGKKNVNLTIGWNIYEIDQTTVVNWGRWINK